MSTDGPYREPGAGPRYICIVCFGAATKSGGTCGTCNAPLLSLESEEVVEEVRKRVASLWSRRQLRDIFLVLGIGGIAGLVVDLLLPVLWNDFFATRARISSCLCAGMALVAVAYLLVSKHKYAFRRLDPWSQDLPSLLRFLGTKIEG